MPGKKGDDLTGIAIPKSKTSDVLLDKMLAYGQSLDAQQRQRFEDELTRRLSDATQRANGNKASAIKDVWQTLSYAYGIK